MQKSRHIVIIAGEESSDIHAGVLIRQLKTSCSNLRVSGIGGRHMLAAGAELISDLAQYGVTGFTEVIRYLHVIRKALRLIKEHLAAQKPDLLILVDYPGFNLRVAQYAKKELGLKILYYISPQIWAWKANRIHIIKECVDRMAVILPFEKDLYEKAGVPVNFVGHPLVEKMTIPLDIQSSRILLNLPEQKEIIALLPGSRNNEIERHMPVLKETAHLLHQKNRDLHFVVPIAGTIPEKKITHYFLNSNLPVTFIQGKAVECMIAANFVIVASGTASLECALLAKPMCIIYKSSFITYHAAMTLIKVKFLGLCNLLVNKMMVPEFLQYDCNPVELSRFISEFYQDKAQPQQMIKQLTNLKISLSQEESDCSLADLAIKELL